MTRRTTLVFFFALLSSSLARAAGPGLHTADGELAPSRFELEAEVDGPLAHVRLTLEFLNEGERATGGELAIPLPAGAIIVDHAIDIGGEMVHASIVARERARAAMEAERHRRIDPGLVEWSAGNVFRTKVWPVPAKGSRTVFLAWDQIVGSDADGHARVELPLAVSEPVAEARIAVTLRGSGRAPEVVAGPQLRFHCSGSRCAAETTLRDTALEESLVLELDASQSASPVIDCDDEDCWFALRVQPPDSLEPRQLPSRRIALWWDHSAGRVGSDLAAELQLLGSVLERLAPLEVVIVGLGREVTAGQLQRIGPEDIRPLLRSLADEPLRGGTHLSKATFGPKVPLEGGTRARVDWHLVFTDGLATLGTRVIETPGAPVFAISSSEVVDSAWLERVSSESGGLWLPLTSLPLRAASEAVGLSMPALVAVRAQGADSLHPDSRQPVAGSVLVTGRLSDRSTDLELDWGSVRTTATLRRSDATNALAAGRAWARAEVAQLLAAPDASLDEERLLQLARRFSLVTERSSLLVLETAEQYFRHDIEPPREREELHARWVESRERSEREGLDDLEGRRSALETSIAELALWSTSDFSEQRPAAGPVRQAEAASLAPSPSQGDLNEDSQSPNAVPVAGLSGAVVGLVTDAYGHPYGFVDVFLEATSGSYQGVVLADDDGRFEFSPVPIGDYKLYAYAAGFQSTLSEGVRVTPHRTLSYTIQLQPQDGIYEIVAVDARLVDMVDTKRTESSVALEGEFSRQIPLANKRIQDIVALFAGVTRPGARDSTDISIAGGRSSQIGYRLNGSSITDPVDGGASLDISTAAMQDFKLLSGGFGSQYGEQSTGIADLVETSQGDGGAIDEPAMPPGPALAAPLAAAGEARDARLDVLTGALDLAPGNEDLLRAVAYHALALDETQLAFELLSELHRRRPDEPQALRDLALALQDLARARPRRSAELWQRSATLLEEVIRGDWDERFENVELITLVDFAALLRECDRHGIEIAHSLPGEWLEQIDIDADLHVELRWNLGWADVDLIVEQADGESCNYRHRNTARGGRLSVDLTEGLGPETYSIRQAPRGAHEVVIHAYDLSEVAGDEVTVLVDLITDYGRANERRHRRAVTLTEDGEKLPTFRVRTGDGRPSVRTSNVSVPQADIEAR